MISGVNLVCWYWGAQEHKEQSLVCRPWKKTQRADHKDHASTLIAFNVEKAPALLRLAQLALAVADLKEDRSLEPTGRQTLQQLAAILKAIQDETLRPSSQLEMS